MNFLKKLIYILGISSTLAFAFNNTSKATLNYNPQGNVELNALIENIINNHNGYEFNEIEAESYDESETESESDFEFESEDEFEGFPGEAEIVVEINGLQYIIGVPLEK